MDRRSASGLWAVVAASLALLAGCGGNSGGGGGSGNASGSSGLSSCNAWHQTSQCSANGAVEPSNDQTCDVTILASWSGYCDCAGGTVGADCGHAEETCNDVCAAGSWGVTLGAAADGGTGSGSSHSSCDPSTCDSEDISCDNDGNCYTYVCSCSGNSCACSGG